MSSNQEQALFNPLNSFTSIMSSYAPNSIVLNAALDMFKNSKSKGFKGFLLCFIKSSPMIASLLLLSHLFNRMDALLSVLNKILSLLYKNFLFKKHKVSNENQKLSKIMLDVVESERYNQESMYPTCYITKDDEDTYLHSLILSNTSQKLVEISNKRLEQETKSLISSPMLYIGNVSFKYVKHIPTTLYPSNNYRGLCSVIDDFIELSTILECYKVKGVLINGKPGLGKSAFGDYYTENTKQCKSIFRIDLSEFVIYDLNDIFTKFILKLTNPSVFVLDELDKYVKFHIDLKYQQHREKYFDETSNEKGMELKTKSLFKVECKTKILLSILRVLETTGNRFPCCVLFCSNNFHTIFNGVSMKHFESLTTRFIVHDFTECNKNEFIGYCRYYNERCKDTKFYCDNLENILLNVPDSISLTWREVDALKFSHGCDYQKMVNALNSGADKLLLNLLDVNNSDFDEESDDEDSHINSQRNCEDNKLSNKLDEKESFCDSQKINRKKKSVNNDTQHAKVEPKIDIDVDTLECENLIATQDKNNIQSLITFDDTNIDKIIQDCIDSNEQNIDTNEFIKIVGKYLKDIGNESDKHKRLVLADELYEYLAIPQIIDLVDSTPSLNGRFKSVVYYKVKEQESEMKYFYDTLPNKNDKYQLFEKLKRGYRPLN